MIYVAILLMMAGCTYLTVGDGAFGITGSLPPKAQSCELALFTEDGAELQFRRRKIRGEFREDFVVAPYARAYRATVFCDGTARKSMTVRYGTDVKSGQYVSLGEIAL